MNITFIISFIVGAVLTHFTIRLIKEIRQIIECQNCGQWNDLSNNEHCTNCGVKIVRRIDRKK